jgi:hypothetical protein
VRLLSWWLPIALCVATSLWNPAQFAARGTIEFLTVTPDEGEHWSTVWFVMIDRTMYVRLGPRAARRIEKNTTAPRLALRIAGKESFAARYEKAPGMAGAVAVAMREKYWSDILGEPFRRLGLTSEAVILRLTPDPASLDVR